jgi:putative tricarboxylic transport membrane protein
MVMAFVLCPFLEEAFRQSLIKSHGDFSIFIKQPISGAILVISFLVIILNIFTIIKRKRKELIKKILEEG